MDHYPSQSFQDHTFQTSISFEFPESSPLQKFINSSPKDPSYINPYNLSFNSTLKSREINPDDIDLPNGVNFVALRETFLSEAPFVKHFNRLFWKKWVDTRQFQVILSQFLRLIQECVSEDGVFNVKMLYGIIDHPCLHELSYTNFSKFNQLKKKKNLSELNKLFSPDDGYNSSIGHGRATTSPSMSRTNHLQKEFEHEWPYRSVVEKLAVNVAEMLLMNRNIGGENTTKDEEENEKESKKKKKGTSGSSGSDNNKNSSKKQSINMRGKNGESKQHDILFYHMPEILTYMLIQALLAHSPKLSKLFYSIRFRIILYNWLNENIHGIKVNNHALSNYHLSDTYKSINMFSMVKENKDKDNLKDSFAPHETKSKREKKIENITWILRDSFDHPIFVVDKETKFKKSSKKSKSLANTNSFNNTQFSTSSTIPNGSALFSNSVAQEKTIFDINTEIINKQFNIEQCPEEFNETEEFNLLSHSTSNFASSSNLLPNIRASRRSSMRNSINFGVLNTSFSSASISSPAQSPFMKSNSAINASSANLMMNNSTSAFFNESNTNTIKDVSAIDFNDEDQLNSLGIKSQTQAQQVNLYPRFSAAQSYFSMGNSPLIQIYMNLGRITLADNKNIIMASSLTNDPSLLSYTQIDPPYQCSTKSNILLSHLATSPLVTVNHDIEGNEKNSTKYRFKKVNPSELKSIIQGSETNRQNILSKFKHINAKEKEEHLKSKQLLKIQLDILEKKPVSQKKLLQALQNSTVISSTSTNPSAGLSNNTIDPSLSQSHGQGNLDNNLAGNSLSFPSVSQFDVED